MKKFLCLCLTFIVLACLMLSACQSENPKDPERAFDESAIQLSFGAISDTHLGDKNADESLRRVLRYIQTTIGTTPDIYLLSGDMTNTTAKTEEKTEIQLFKTVFEEVTANKTPLLYSLGPSHDLPSAAPCESVRMLYYSTFGPSYFANDLEPSTMLAKGFRHMNVKGYHFFAIDWPGGAAKTYAAEDLNWLETSLKAAADEDPNKPIFISVHVPDVEQLTAIFAKFPQIVCFTGHVHNSVAREDSITQDAGFTNVHCGGVNYYRVDGYNRFYKDDNPYLALGNIHDFAQGLVVQVDVHQNVRITRVDGYNNAILGSPWEFAAGNVTKYTAARKYSAANCSFDDTAKLKVVAKDRSLSVSFDAAKTGEAGPAQYYKIELLAPDATGKYTVLEHVELSSQQVFFPNDQNIPDYHYAHTFANVNSLSDFAVVVTAWDCWDVSENALMYTNGSYKHAGPISGTAQYTNA